MKTKELIRQLQEADPSGEIEVCVGNIDIHFVERLPAYYDGRLEVLKRDEDCEYYNIIGGEFVAEGDKVMINTLMIEDAIWNNPDLPVSFERCDSCMNCDNLKEYVGNERKKAREFHAERAERRAKTVDSQGN